MSLVDSVDVVRWAAAAGAYAGTLRNLFQHKNASVIDLDEFVQSALPAAIAARSPPHMLKVEYCRLVQWKLRKGKFRPNLEKFANELAAGAVEAASTAAFSDVVKDAVKGGDAGLKSALKALTALKGNGPATATAVLAAYDTSVPFMSDEALAAAFPGRPIVYKVEEALALTERLRAVAHALNDAMRVFMMDGSVDAATREEVCAAVAACPGGPPAPLWTAQRVQNALWSNARAGTAPVAAPRGKLSGAAIAPPRQAAAPAAAPPEPAIIATAAPVRASAAASSVDASAAAAGVKRGREETSMATRRASGRLPTVFAPPPACGTHTFPAAALVASPDPVVTGSSRKKRREAPSALDTSEPAVLLHANASIIQSLLSPPGVPSMVSPALGAVAPRLL